VFNRNISLCSLKDVITMVSQAWRYMHVIPTTEEVEAGEWRVQGQPGKVSETLSQKPNKSKDLEV
jgi:hypothetical protein